MTHKPTEATRQLVKLHAAIGTPHTDIAMALDVDPKTLRKHYREEIDKGALQANARIGQTLFNKAVGGDTTAAIFWAKTRMRWRETNRHEHSGPDGENIPHTVKLTFEK